MHQPVIVDQQTIMKVHHRLRDEWSMKHFIHLLKLFAVYCCMLMQYQQHTLAAMVGENYNAVDSEIFGVNSTDGIDNHDWLNMQNQDIWSDVPASASDEDLSETTSDEYEFVESGFNGDVNVDDGVGGTENETLSEERQSKVLHIFPVPVDGECISDDGRRTGTCFNAYECRQKGGEAKGDCAMGFGVCCIFVANCNTTISNNITYLVSPQFPSFMPSNFTSCSIRVQLMSEDVSQLRIDFNHFSLGQPNRRTGVCDGDVFNISGGPGGTFSLCGQNSGQHLYYDVGGRSLPRQTLYGSLRPPTLAQLYPNFNMNATGNQPIEISMNFTQRFLPIRLWEIRIAQIPFSQRAPAGCLQYHHGVEGIIQTFNFADNGRHLANQHYRVCVRQETEMCSIMYQPCDEQSFRIGPSMPFGGGIMQQPNIGAGSLSGGGGAGGLGGSGNPASLMMPSSTSSVSTSTMAVTPSAAASNDTMTSATTPTTQMSETSPATMSSESTTLPMRTTSASTSTANTTVSTPSDTASNATTAASTTTSMASTAETSTATMTTTTTTTTMTTPTSTPSSTTTTAALWMDEVEGSGDEDAPVTPSRRPRPVSGGFDLLGFLRSAFELGLGRRRNPRNMQQFPSSQQRQIFSSCTDRITLPCIIEDFIGTGLGPLPSCEPVHCGSQFCSSGVWPCRIESTVTPFFINIHFGDGAGKGSAEDNIGACLRYTQVQCI